MFTHRLRAHHSILMQSLCLYVFGTDGWSPYSIEVCGSQIRRESVKWLVGWWKGQTSNSIIHPSIRPLLLKLKFVMDRAKLIWGRGSCNAISTARVHNIQFLFPLTFTPHFTWLVSSPCRRTACVTASSTMEQCPPSISEHHQHQLSSSNSSFI